MYRKNITYKDFDGNNITEPFYFNLTQAEVLKLETKFISKFGMGIQETLQVGATKRDPEMVLGILELLIGSSYGQRVDNKFNKSTAITSAFMASEAYSSLIFDMIENDGETDAFIKNVLPDMDDMNNRITRLMDKRKELSAGNVAE